MEQDKRTKKDRRHKRIRSKIKGTGKIPRLCVFRSNKHIYGQLIDDEKGRTLLVASDIEIKSKVKSPSPRLVRLGRKKLEVAGEVGQLLAQKAIEKKVEKVVFDRGGYKYHGKIKALAEGARKGGLKF
jgi:large subunit ribosomal protein L18